MASTDVVEKSKNSMDKQTLLAVLHFLKSNNLQGTEELLRKEAGLSAADVRLQGNGQTASDVSDALSSFRSQGDPKYYEDYYTNLKDFVEKSLDIHKCELSLVLYPVFVHMYLELVYNRHEQAAAEFMARFGCEQEYYYAEDVARLGCVTRPEHMHGNQLLENFKTGKFTIRMSRDSYNHLKRHHMENKQTVLLNIVNEHLFVDVFDGVPRNAKQIEAASGAMLGEAKKEANKAKIQYGLLKEPDLNIPLDEDDEEPDDKPKKRKSKKDPSLTKKSKTDPNAPPITRIPMPEWRDIDKLEKVNLLRELRKKVDLAADSLPSVCFYTFLNAYQGATCVSLSDDSSLMSAGFADSQLRVFSLTPDKLRAMKPAQDLALLDREAEDISARMVDDSTATDSLQLLGHSGPVYASSFTPDRSMLLSCSEDGTLRLWSMLTWSNIVCFKSHVFPVWDCVFGPYGHYFASGGHDRTVRLWSTAHHQPLRFMVGHLADVDAVTFHPNSNFIASGSTDRTVRLWDVASGNCVRVMTGHKGPVHSLAFSPDGKYLASGGADKNILMWDVSTGDMVGHLKGHTDTVYSLAYSREASVLASGSLDGTVRLWDINKVTEDAQDAEPGAALNTGTYELLTLPTKNTPVLDVHFTRRNLLVASGPYSR